MSGRASGLFRFKEKIMRINLNPRFVPHLRQRWFAWHPVETECGTLVWLEEIFRAIDRNGRAYYMLKRI
jgi:hypothetical protein